MVKTIILQDAGKLNSNNNIHPHSQAVSAAQLPAKNQCVLCKSLSQSIYSAIGIILLLYEYSQKISAHSQHYQTSKSCDIDDLDNNLMYYCTYLYALSQYNQTINSGKTSPPQPYSLKDKQSCLQWFDAQFLQTINTRW